MITKLRTPHYTVLTNVHYTASVAYAYIDLEFRNYPSDWQGFIVAIFDEGNKNKPAFWSSKRVEFRPSDNVVYDEDSEVVFFGGYYDEDTGQWEEGTPLYYDDGTPITDVNELNIKVNVPVQLENKTAMLTKNLEDEVYLYLTPFAVKKGETIFGETLIKEITEGGNYIDIIEGEEKQQYRVFYGGTDKEFSEVTAENVAAFWSNVVLEEFGQYENFTYQQRVTYVNPTEDDFFYMWLITPYRDDDVVIEGFKNEPILSVDGLPIPIVKQTEYTQDGIQYVIYRVFNIQRANKIDAEVR